MRRRAFMGLALTPLLLAAAKKPAPFLAVEALYASLPRPTPPALLSKRLRALMRKDEARRARHLDFEWRTGGQDSAAITRFGARLVRLKGDAATVEVSFDYGGERRFRRFFLIREGDRWVIDDVLLVPENGKLADFLRGVG